MGKHHSVPLAKDGMKYILSVNIGDNNVQAEISANRQNHPGHIKWFARKH